MTMKSTKPTHFLSIKAALKVVPLYLILLFSVTTTSAQYDIGEYSVARMWNEALLEAIRDELAIFFTAQLLCMTLGQFMTQLQNHIY